MFTSNISRENRVKRTAFSLLFCIVFAFSMMLSLSLTVYAAGGVSIENVIELAYAIRANSDKNPINVSGVSALIEEDWKSPDPDCASITNIELKAQLTYSRLKSLSDALDKNYIRSDKTKQLYRYAVIAKTIYRGFESQTTYDAAITKLCAPDWTTAVNAMKPVPSGNTLENAVTSAVSGFTGAIAQGTVTDAFSGTFDMSDWDPNAGVAGAAMSTIGNVVNQIFFIVSNLMMWLFMAQTGFDVLYLVIEPIRPFLTKGGGDNGGLSNNGGGSGVLSKFRLPICSSAAVEAANGGGNGGGLGGNQAGQGKGAVVTRYLGSRAPVLILCAIYLILVTMGYWQQLIGWIAGFVIQALDWIMTLGK